MKRRSWWIKEVAHTFAAGACERRGRFLGLLVVVLTTVIGTGTFAALQNNPSQAAKLTVAILAVAAAVSAAVKEFFQYGKTSAEHLEEAAKYGSLKDQADDLADELKAHSKVWSDANKELIKLEQAAEALDRTPPMVVGRPYSNAEKWVQDKGAGEQAELAAMR
jgi:hypothetical protein